MAKPEKSKPSKPEDDGSDTEHPVEGVARRYLSAIRGIYQTASVAVPHVAQQALSEVEKIQEKLDQIVPDLENAPHEEKVVVIATARDAAEFTQSLQQLSDLRSHDAPQVLIRSLFTQLFAEFDSFTGQLIKTIYLRNHNLLKGISRQISLSDLMEFEDLNSVKISMLEKEVETIRRDSYIEQFANLENRFGLTLRRFKEWPDFVELSQRRNLITHNGGLVSEQYLIVCEREGYKFSARPKIGEATGVDIPYFRSACLLLSKVGLMLTFTLWSKIFPAEHATIHDSLNDIIYRCLQHKRWKFVSTLEDFVLSQPMRQNISEFSLRIRTVNVAIGLKFGGDDAASRRLLGSLDWTACYRDFQLALAILEEKYDHAITLMKSIGKSGEILTQSAYHQWPLFNNFREKSQFYQTYFEIYGEHFAEKVDSTSVEVELKVTAQGRSKSAGPEVVDVEATEVKSAPRPAKKRTVGAPKLGQHRVKTDARAATKRGRS